MAAKVVNEITMGRGTTKTTSTWQTGKTKPTWSQTRTNNKTHTTTCWSDWSHDSTSPPRSATWRTQEGLTSSPTEVLDQSRIQNAPGRNPTPLLWTVTLPVHQILETPTTASNVQELSHSVHWSTIHYTRGRGGSGKNQQREEGNETQA